MRVGALQRCVRRGFMNSLRWAVGERRVGSGVVATLQPERLGRSFAQVRDKAAKWVPRGARKGGRRPAAPWPEKPRG